MTDEPEKLPARSSKVPGDIAAPNYAVILDRLVRDPSVPMERVERALALVERQREIEAKARFGVAMAQAQREMEPVSRDMANPSTRSKYASHAAIDRAIRPSYSKYDLAPTFNSRASPKGESWITITCDVIHAGGWSKDYEIDMPCDGVGAKGGQMMTKTHAVMSAVTYGRRGLLKMIFNLAEGDDVDDDGNAATGEPVEVITEQELVQLRERIDQVGQTEGRVCDYYGVVELQDLPRAKFAAAMKKLEISAKK